MMRAPVRSQSGNGAYFSGVDGECGLLLRTFPDGSSQFLVKQEIAATPEDLWLAGAAQLQVDAGGLDAERDELHAAPVHSRCLLVSQATSSDVQQGIAG